jgi:MFS family permease
MGNAFVWYYTVLASLQSTKPNILVWIVHFSALILSALVGASFGKRFERSKFLILWMIIGVASSTMLFALSSTSVMLVNIVSLFLGLSIGFGMPACMSYFNDNVEVTSRGRTSGVTILVSGVGMVAFGLAPTSDLFTVGIILGIWRFSSLLVFLKVKNYRGIKRKENELSYKQVLGQRSFVLYFAPWIMFSFVNYFANPIGASNVEYNGVGLVQNFFMGASAVFGGIFVDSVGRKRIAIAGFAMLGLGAAVLGFSGNSLTEIPFIALYFNAVVGGIAWGFLLVLFVLTLWGDLSHNSPSDKYYALGVMPFFVLKFLELTVGNYIPSSVTSSTALVSFTVFFLFLAVLPLVYAPETLPEKVMKDRDLKSYVEKAMRKVQSEVGNEKIANGSLKKCEVEFYVKAEESDGEQEEAERLAEKYY